MGFWFLTWNRLSPALYTQKHTYTRPVILLMWDGLGVFKANCKTFST